MCHIVQCAVHGAHGAHDHAVLAVLPQQPLSFAHLGTVHPIRAWQPIVETRAVSHKLDFGTR